MNSRTLRRLAADHGALHNQPLPPNYLLPPSSASADDLTQLDILLAGPTHTPFAAGVWKLHLTFPSDYPQQPPTAHFRTPIFHPNVEPQTGGVCVETLKRDWDSKLTLRDVLVTISCLLIQPNPDSALNAEAGALIQENYEAFARRAQLMTSIHATVPKALQTAVSEAQGRGHEGDKQADKVQETESMVAEQVNAPRRRRGPPIRQRAAPASRRSNGSPSEGATNRRLQFSASQPFAAQARNDDVFGMSRQSQESSTYAEDNDSSTMEANQENDASKSPTKATMPIPGTPQRPRGAAVPLGELIMEDAPSSSDDDVEEREYPPSPRKSPGKSPAKRESLLFDNVERAESSRDAMVRAPNITPPHNLDNKPLAEDSMFAATTSPRKGGLRPETPASGKAPLFSSFSTPLAYGGIFKTRPPSSAERRSQEADRKAELEVKLWDLCGQDVRRWNRGDFDGEPFKMKAKRR